MAQLTEWSITTGGEISLTFDESVTASTFDPTAITLQGAASGADHSTTTFPNTNRAVLENPTSFTLGFGSINDLNAFGNAIDDNAGSPTIIYAGDRVITIAGSLLRDDFGLDNATMTAEYNTVENARFGLATFPITYRARTASDPANGTITNGIQTYTLTGGTPTPATGSSTSIRVALTRVDRNAIAALTSLATVRDHSFLSATSDLVMNVDGTAFTAVSSTSATQAAMVVAGGITPDRSVAGSGGVAMQGMRSSRTMGRGMMTKGPMRKGNKGMVKISGTRVSKARR